MAVKGKRLPLSQLKSIRLKGSPACASHADRGVCECAEFLMCAVIALCLPVCVRARTGRSSVILLKVENILIITWMNIRFGLTVGHLTHEACYFIDLCSKL